ncbi:hypothetical protein CIT292_08403 [Citrobacter youngae ATCC 29220]|uniref:Uncharacterized protein n=1 Tax=Citrobacter youngae ATCC 29220 TaxID=500640 RepID=D4BD36_9ENTR|nr:hypothetical protein CIT292_08403 [Citrobacter youngae ATCC 29220]
MAADALSGLHKKHVACRPDRICQYRHPAFSSPVTSPHNDNIC